MTDFQFLSSDGVTTNFVLRTDFIELSTVDNGAYQGNLTVCQIIDNNPDYEGPESPELDPPIQDDASLANYWQNGSKYNIQDDLMTFADANNLTLTAYPIGGVEVTADSAVTLVTATLPAPQNFQATANTGLVVNLAWHLVPGATTYQIDRATNSGFSTGLVTDINNNSGGDTFEDNSGLAASTTYYYRIKARNLGAGLTDSAYADVNVETTAD